MKNVLINSVAALLFTGAAFAQTSEVGRRAENQQDRIANGIATGKMSAGQAAHVERQEAGVNHEIHADRKANGGKLTGAEKAQVNHQQNRMSHEIYKDKH
jgi:hypothetical protein